jgi:hypothetical protein
MKFVWKFTCKLHKHFICEYGHRNSAKQDGRGRTCENQICYAQDNMRPL